MIDEIQWHNELNVGHDRIDFEHKMFLALIKNIAIAINQDKSNEHLTRLMMELQRYAEFHFFSEENIAIECGELDTQVNAHRRIHQYLLTELEHKVRRYEDGDVLAPEILEFLIDWFAMHAEQDRERVAQFHKNTAA